MTKEVKLNYYRHNISPGDTRSKLEKAKEQYYIRSTMHQPYEARQALWKVRMYERQLYNPGACIIDKEGTDFVSPHPLTRLQDMSSITLLPGYEAADCFPSYDVVKKSAAGKGISPESLQKAYQRVLKTKGQSTKLNSLRRKRTTDEIIEKASFYDLVEGRTKVIAGVKVVNPSKALVELAESEAKKLGALLDSPTFKADIREFLKRVPKEQLDKLEYELNELKKALDARKRTHASSDDLVEEASKPTNYPSYEHVVRQWGKKHGYISDAEMGPVYDAHRRRNAGVRHNGWSKEDWTKHIHDEARRAFKRQSEQAKIKPSASYKWFTYQHDKPVSIKRKTSAGDKPTKITKGMRFGVRKATSAKGKMRLIVKGVGTSKVHTISPRHATMLIGRSKGKKAA
jgi:hypothetical protein